VGVLKLYGVTLDANTTPFRTPSNIPGNILTAELSILNVITLSCFAISNAGLWAEIVDVPKTLAVVTYCPILSTEHAQSLTSHFSLNATLTIFPLHSNESSRGPHSCCGYPFTEPHRVDLSLLANERKYNLSNQLLTTRKYGPAHNLNRYVCAVQLFQNEITGPLMYLFVRYYLELGWRVIIYDQFGRHEKYVSDFLKIDNFHYYSYTVFDKIFPHIYNPQNFQQNEKNPVVPFFSPGMKKKRLSKTETRNHNSNLQKTFDYARMEYSHDGAILFVDIDELLLCPLHATSTSTQRRYHESIFSQAQAKGVGEINFIRKLYGGQTNNATQLTLCLHDGYKEKSIFDLLNCFGRTFFTIPLPKSADLTSSCPFHYDHFACMTGCTCNRQYFEGKKGSTEDVRRCHLMHLNAQEFSKNNVDKRFTFNSNISVNMAASMFM